MLHPSSVFWYYFFSSQFFSSFHSYFLAVVVGFISNNLSFRHQSATKIEENLRQEHLVNINDHASQQLYDKIEQMVEPSYSNQEIINS